MKSKAKAVYEKKMSSLLEKYRDIVYMGVGYRKKDGEIKEGEVCLLIWVKEKLPESDVEPKQLLPKEIDGVPVDILDGKNIVRMLCLIYVYNECTTIKLVYC